METEQTGQRAPLGRPRAFDTEAALERAMLFFWEHGYEGASLSGLTKAMGVSTTSMYTAFGNKEDLFRKALERYTEGPSAYLTRALEEPSARAVATALLTGTVRTTTRPAQPHGCLGVQGALATGTSAATVRDLLAAWREDGCNRLRERFRQAVDEGDLPATTDPGLLGRYVSTLAFGIAVQAASGIGRDELQQMADAALAAWPPF
ncbi:TetR/AcrR family transcriptional regulator [Kitasatospora saccharophila]|uniref:TetR/AcrR family transcriptional regulator n=1 Tax=Kitasatospora saccharophila TaxID=407973 RepID=A0ABP5HZ14_9ACTN